DELRLERHAPAEDQTRVDAPAGADAAVEHVHLVPRRAKVLLALAAERLVHVAVVHAEVEPGAGEDAQRDGRLWIGLEVVRRGDRRQHPARLGDGAELIVVDALLKPAAADLEPPL